METEIISVLLCIAGIGTYFFQYKCAKQLYDSRKSDYPTL